MRVLVACESSGVVRDAFARRGHFTMSCDLFESETPGFHHKGDVRDLLHFGWDLMIAHPPCTYLSVSGMHWTTRGLRDKQLTEDALIFVKTLMGAPIAKIAIENPVSVISTRIRQPDQIVQPWQYGHDASKKTCLWLKGLPKLCPTRIVAPKMFCCGIELPEGVGKYGCANCMGDKVARPRWANQTASGQNRLPPSSDRWREREVGRTKALPTQWQISGV